VRIRKTLVLLGLAILAVGQAAAAITIPGWWRLCGSIFVLGIAGCGVAIARDVFWARRFALSIALVGLSDSIVFAVLFRHASWVAWDTLPLLAGDMLVLLPLLGPKAHEHYDLRPSRYNRWQLDRLAVRTLSRATILTMAAVPRLLLYVGSEADWMTPGRRAMALLATLLMTLAAVLLIAQRSAGLLALVFGGALTLGVAFDAAILLARTCSCAPSVQTTMAIAAFVPGSLAALTAFVLFVPAMIRLLLRASKTR
jgi:hypothetical protein